MLYQQPTGPVEDDRIPPTPGAQGTEDSGDARRSRNRRWYNERLLIVVIAAVLVVDQLTKYIVRDNLGLYQSWPRDGFFRIRHLTNSGSAFGLFPNQTFVLIIFSAVAIGFIYYFYRSQALPSRLLRLAMGLQLGGALGNLFDRVRSGAVVDFIDVGRWPTFNIADSAIMTGIALLIAITFFATEETSKKEDGAGGPDP